jgi:hypothetical protein
MKTKYISLYRTSTRSQELGLLSQRSAVTAYILSTGGILLQEFTEQESGGNKDRNTFGSDINLETL